MTNTLNKGIGGHTRAFQGRTDDWITPEPVLIALGKFDLDPCASQTQPWPTAATQWTIDDEGFNREWFGRVWLNPPYGPETGRWLEKLAKHGNGVALVFARTETRMFFDWVWPYADSVLFLEGRLYFHLPDGTRAPHNSGGPSVLIGYGSNNTAILENCGLNGKCVRIREPQTAILGRLGDDSSNITHITGNAV